MPGPSAQHIASLRVAAGTASEQEKALSARYLEQIGYPDAATFARDNAEFNNQTKWGGFARMIPIAASFASIGGAPIAAWIAQANDYVRGLPIVKSIADIASVAAPILALRNPGTTIETIVDQPLPQGPVEPLPQPEEVPVPIFVDPLSPEEPSPTLPFFPQPQYDPERFYFGSLGGGVPVGILGMMPSGLMSAIGQQTIAARTAMAKVSGRKGGRKSARRRKKKGVRVKRSSKTRRKSTTKGVLKKGTAAAKAWGAKMRRLRKKK